VCAQIADVQVRNKGTIGGNICTNDPTNHLPPLLAALRARMTIAGSDGERTVDSAEFFLGVYLTAVAQGEVLTKVTIPAGRQDGFAAVTLGVEGTCIASAAASVNGSVTLALGCVDAVPVVLAPASAGEDDVRAAVRNADLNPPSDVHASAAYRAHLSEVLAARAVKQAQEAA
jgi:carbon-monoxide dehydrogenase medium subunit